MSWEEAHRWLLATTQACVTALTCLSESIRLSCPLKAPAWKIPQNRSRGKNWGQGLGQGSDSRKARGPSPHAPDSVQALSSRC